MKTHALIATLSAGLAFTGATNAALVGGRAGGGGAAEQQQAGAQKARKARNRDSAHAIHVGAKRSDMPICRPIGAWLAFCAL